MNVNPLTILTSVTVCKNVPLDNTYRDTMDFSSVSQQYTYFMTKAKHTFTELAPVRMQNAIRLPCNADNLYDCNYLIFQNANFSQKYFYAFIKEIRFINPNMSEVVFELDVIQTWWFDFQVKESFVEREHIENDIIGANVVPENLEIGDYIFAKANYAGVATTPVVVIASTLKEDGSKAEGGYYGGIYSGIEYIKKTNATEINNYIAKVTAEGGADSIVAIFMAYDEFFAEKDKPPATKEIKIDKKYDEISGYVPKNNKLFTYPYNFLYCINTCGNSANFKYEYFADNQCIFGLIGESSCNPQITMVPRLYKYSSVNMNEKMVLNGFPQCSWNIDSFKAWLAQNGASTALSVLGSATALAGGIVAKNPTAVTGGIFGVADTLARVHVESAKPPQASGSPGSGASFAYGQLDFIFYHTQITADFAKQIDDFFSMYGYATHKLKVPNINSRPSWNYVKTIDCCIVGSVPFDDMAKIRSIFDKGVTFWHGDWVGDYTRDNK